MQRMQMWGASLSCLAGIARSRAQDVHAFLGWGDFFSSFGMILGGAIIVLLSYQVYRNSRVFKETKRNLEMKDDLCNKLSEQIKAQETESSTLTAELISLGKKLAHTERLERDRSAVLEMMVSGLPIARALDKLMLSVEALDESSRCSILLFEKERNSLRHGSAPSLPKEYIKAIDGVRIGPAVGSCGTAAYTQQPVVVENIATDPLWKDYKHVALPHGLRSCWSTPIIGPGNLLLGTFAIYRTKAELPSHEQRILIDEVTSTAALCLMKARSEEHLQLALERLNLAISAASIGIIEIHCRSGQTRFSNESLKILKLQQDEMAFGQLLERVHAEDQVQVREALSPMLNSSGQIAVQFRFRIEKGHYLWIELRGAIRQNDRDQKHRIVGVVRDASVIKENEFEHSDLSQKLRQSQKLETLGYVSSGILHEFNNILGVMVGSIGLAKSNTENKSELLENLRQLELAGERARKIILYILAFCRQETEIQNELLELSEIVRESVGFFRVCTPSIISFDLDLPHSKLFIHGDATMVQQILFNLLQNAVQAIGNRPDKILCRLKRAHISDCSTDLDYGMSSGNYALLSVEDDGFGIAPEVQPHIFEPFFTTKQKGQGTGLGLPMVKAAMQVHRGGVYVESTPGSGSVFRLYFPTVEEPSESDSSSIPKIQPTSKCYESLLIVDDEESLLRVYEQALTRNGFRVTTFTDPVLAFEAFTRCPHAYDLLLTDYSMPGMNGISLIRNIKRTRSELPVIMCSGYGAELSAQEIKKLGISEILMKPITIEELYGAVRKALLYGHEPIAP